MTGDLPVIREVKTALPRRVVDGDTWWCYLDLGYRQLGYFEFRLLGWDTPEKYGLATSPAERDAARFATEVAINWWADHIKAGGRRIFVRSLKDPEKFGRWLADLWAETPSGEQFHLGDHLAELGLAVPSDGTAGTRWRDTHGGGK